MLAAAIASLLAGHAASAANATWNGTIDTTWADAGNWSAATPGSGNTATFSNAGNSNTTLDLGGGVTITTMLFDTDSAAAYTIGKDGPGSQALTLNASGAITLNPSVTTSQLFDANLTLGTATGTNSFTVTNNSTAASQLLVLAGAVSSTTTGAKTLTVSGAGNTEMTGIISTGSATTFALTKSGPGTLTLKGANSYNGLTSVAGGTLKVDAGAGGSLYGTAPYSALTLSGGGTFNYDNTTAAEAKLQNMGALTLPLVNGDNTVQLTRTAAQNTAITFTSASLLPGAGPYPTINFVYAGTSGTIGVDSKVVLTGRAAGWINTGNTGFAFVNGGDFAWYDSTGYVRAPMYDGTAAEGTTSGGGASIAMAPHQQLTGGLTSQAASSLTTLKINGAFDIVNTGTLTLGVDLGGILKTGGGIATINGAVNLSATSQIIRTDTTSDVLILANGMNTTGRLRFIKSGAGTLKLMGNSAWAEAITGSDPKVASLYINDGVVEVGGSAVIKNSLDKLSLQIANGALFKFNSSGNQLINRLITGQGRLAMTGTGTLTLSGPNSYTGGTTVSAGILTFLTTAAKTGSTTVDADATLGLGVGGSGTFTSANVDSLFAGTLAGVTMGPAVNVALDTTNGDFTYATNQSAARSLTKLGANTLTLTGTNSYSGGTNVMAGTLTFLNPAAKTGSTTVAAGATLGLGVGAGLFSLTDVDDLWANTLANVSMDAASGVGIDTTAGDLSYATSQSGSRSLTKLGANTLTVSGDNSYTGLTTVSVGTLKLGAAGSGANSPLGTAGAGTLVRPGAALDLNGFTLATAEALTSD